MKNKRGSLGCPFCTSQSWTPLVLPPASAPPPAMPPMQHPAYPSHSKQTKPFVLKHITKIVLTSWRESQYIMCQDLFPFLSSKLKFYFKEFPNFHNVHRWRQREGGVCQAGCCLCSSVSSRRLSLGRAIFSLTPEVLQLKRMPPPLS